MNDTHIAMRQCDAWYFFSFIDVGNYGSNSDSEIFLNS